MTEGLHGVVATLANDTKVGEVPARKGNAVKWQVDYRAIGWM